MITIEEILREPVRALSWKQPYGTLMLAGKQETRIWSTEYRGLVLICTSKSGYNYSQTVNISGSRQAARVPGVYQKYIGHTMPGHAIAVGRLTGCQKMDTYKDGQNIIEHRTFVSYNPDLYVHLYEHVTPIEPFPWSGQLGWKTLSPEEKSLIKLLPNGK